MTTVKHGESEGRMNVRVRRDPNGIELWQGDDFIWIAGKDMVQGVYLAMRKAMKKNGWEV